MSNNKRETEANSGPIATSPTKSGSNKKTRGPAVIPPRMRNVRTGAPFNWDDYNPNEDYTSYKLPISSRVALAAHYIDRSISPEFTAAVMRFLDQNWDDSLRMSRQPWYRKLQSTEAPDMVELEAARVVNGGEFPDGICEAAKLSGHGQKWLSEQQKKTAAENKRNAAAAPSNGRASKKVRKSYGEDETEDENDDVIGGN